MAWNHPPVLTCQTCWVLFEELMSQSCMKYYCWQIIQPQYLANKNPTLIRVERSELRVRNVRKYILKDRSLFQNERTVEIHMLRVEIVNKV